MNESYINQLNIAKEILEILEARPLTGHEKRVVCEALETINSAIYAVNQPRYPMLEDVVAFATEGAIQAATQDFAVKPIGMESRRINTLLAELAVR